MKRIVCLFLLSITLLFACGQSVGSREARPASTDSVVSQQWYCHRWMWERNDDINDEARNCRNENPTNPDHCDEIAAVEVQENYDNWYTCLDDLPMISNDCRMQLNHADPEQDTDGDGISDYMESWMSLNPCEKCSYGGVEGVDCDADLDFDDDGIPNGEDHDPGCGGNFQQCFF